MKKHIWVDSNVPELLDETLDRYAYCMNCDIIRVIRANGDIQYIFVGGKHKVEGKLLQFEPACLKMVSHQ